MPWPTVGMNFVTTIRKNHSYTGTISAYLFACPYHRDRYLPRMIEQARSKYAVNTIDFHCMDVMDMKDEQFDFIIAYSVFPQPGSFDVYVNNKPVSTTSELTMEPHRYEVVIKYLTAENDTCPPT